MVCGCVGVCVCSVLVETFEEGRSVQVMLEEVSDIPPEIRHQYASIGLNIFLKMLFVDNFVHAGTH
jgi:aarF domain-containing kinase